MTEENRIPELVKETVEKLKGLTYSDAITVLEYAKKNLENNLTLN